MQPQSHPMNSSQHAAKVAAARAADDTLSDAALLTLLGGLYLGGLAAFVSAAYALSLVV